MTLLKCLWTLAITVLLTSAFAIAAGDRPYYPENGRAAVHQHAMDILNPASVLYIAFQPGAEDLPALASLRMGVGSQVTVLYVTNGGATPSDLNGEVSYVLAGRRKDEAASACRFLDFRARFLSFPDLGVLPDSSLQGIWGADTVVASLKTALEEIKPDVIMLGFDPQHASGESYAQTYLLGLIRRAIALEPAWKVDRIFVEQSGRGSLRPRVDALHPLWRKSYRAIAADAAGSYRSLRALRARWAEIRAGVYRYVPWKNEPAPSSLVGGLPAMSARMKHVQGAIVRAGGGAGGGVKSPSLRDVSAAIDSLEPLMHTIGLKPLESRLVSSWRYELEALRCALLNVRVVYESSDSLLSVRQLFYVRVRQVKARTSTSPMEIIFPPAIESDPGGWIINERRRSRFPLDPPAEFRILTPEKLTFDYPTSIYGLANSELGLPFSFILFHRDSVREHNFAYRAEWPLRIGPKRAFQVLTPFVRALPGEPIVYSFLNFSRDAFRGQIELVDSLLPSVVRRNVDLKRKDDLVVDTLYLPAGTRLPEGDRIAMLNISGGGGQWPIVLRSFDVRTDSGAAIGLISGIQSSPVEEALRRMHLPYQDIDPAAASRKVDSFRVIIMDREALVLRSGALEIAGSLRGWVERGGHLVFMPQYVLGQEKFPFADVGVFDDRRCIGPESELALDSTHQFLNGLNRYNAADWTGWVVSRAFGTLHATAGGDVPVRDAASGDPLLLTRKLGSGRITLVALDMQSQLSNMKPGTHRLLANILATH